MRFLTILILMMSCNSSAPQKADANAQLDTQKIVVGKKFFDYDAIDYYLYDFDEAEIDMLYENQSKSLIDSFKNGIVLEDIPNSLNDLEFIKYLPKIGYTKKTIDSSMFNAIDQIFVEKFNTYNVATACIYIYRDILIFKKNDQVIGTAKICFSCMANQIKGSAAMIDNFGQEGDYDRLGELLRNKK